MVLSKIEAGSKGVRTVNTTGYANCKDVITIAAKITHAGLFATAPDVDPEPDADVAALPIVEEAVVALAAPTAGV